MATRGIGQLMIERYAKTRGERLFRADEGGYLILQDSARGHFPVHMRAHGSVVELRPRWSPRVAHADRISQFSITDEVDFEAFGRFVDSSLASAATLLEGAYADAKLPSAAELARWFQISA
jgi:hypothetical protein